MLESFSSGNWQGVMEIDKEMKQRFLSCPNIGNRGNSNRQWKGAWGDRN